MDKPRIAVGADNLRANFRRYCQAVRKGDGRVVILRHGREVGALVSVADLEALEALPGVKA